MNNIRKEFYRSYIGDRDPLFTFDACGAIVTVRFPRKSLAKYKTIRKMVLNNVITINGTNIFKRIRLRFFKSTYSVLEAFFKKLLQNYSGFHQDFDNKTFNLMFKAQAKGYIDYTTFTPQASSDFAYEQQILTYVDNENNLDYIRHKYYEKGIGLTSKDYSHFLLNRDDKVSNEANDLLKDFVDKHRK